MLDVIQLSEEWRDIPGSPGYRVSNLGEIISPRGRKMKQYKRYEKKTGEPRALELRLRRNGETKGVKVHNLVGMAFLGYPPTPTMTIDHIDWNPFNNIITNLRWATKLQQVRHRRGREKVRKFSMSDINEMYRLSDTSTLEEIGKQFGVSRTVIYNILRFVHPEY